MCRALHPNTRPGKRFGHHFGDDAVEKLHGVELGGDHVLAMLELMDLDEERGRLSVGIRRIDLCCTSPVGRARWGDAMKLSARRQLFTDILVNVLNEPYRHGDFLVPHRYICHCKMVKMLDLPCEVMLTYNSSQISKRKTSIMGPFNSCFPTSRQVLSESIYKQAGGS